MPSGNGAKAAQRRERANKDKPAEAKSQLDLNKKAMSVQCAQCKQVWSFRKYAFLLSAFHVYN